MPSPKMLSALPISKDVAAPSDPKNLEGVYTAASMGLPSGFDNSPFTEKAAKEQAYAREMMAKGMPLGGLAAICRPTPPFGVGSDLFPGEITQNDKYVVLLNEEHRTRWIVYLNRVHPADLKPTYFGHSIGHWEGDTLVVETRGFNGKVDLLSPQAVVVSRIRKIEGGSKIEIKNTTTDPVNFTRPVERASVSSWNPGVQVLEFQCEENMEGAAEGLIMDTSKPTL